MKKLAVLALALALILGLARVLRSDGRVLADRSGIRLAHRQHRRPQECHPGRGLDPGVRRRAAEAGEQIKALRNFISQGVDYILFTGVVTTGWDEVLRKSTRPRSR